MKPYKPANLPNEVMEGIMVFNETEFTTMCAPLKVIFTTLERLLPHSLTRDGLLEIVCLPEHVEAFRLVNNHISDWAGEQRVVLTQGGAPLVVINLNRGVVLPDYASSASQECAYLPAFNHWINEATKLLNEYSAMIHTLGYLNARLKKPEQFKRFIPNLINHLQYSMLGGSRETRIFEKKIARMKSSVRPKSYPAVPAYIVEACRDAEALYTQYQLVKDIDPDYGPELRLSLHNGVALSPPSWADGAETPRCSPYHAAYFSGAATARRDYE